MGLLTPPLGYAQRWTNWTSPGADASISDPASAHTKSSYVQLTAGEAFEMQRLVLWFNSYGTSGVDSSALVDVAIGGAGSEQILLPDLFAGGLKNKTGGISYIYDFPVAIPASTRIAARMQGARTDGTLRVTAVGYGGASQPPPCPVEQVTTYGVVSASSSGTAVTSGSSGAEAGSWTNIGSATVKAHQGLLMMPCLPTGSAVTANNYLFDLAVDGQILAENVHVGTASDESQCGPVPNDIIWADIPAGSQIQMRASCNGTAETVRGIVYGIN